jgi:hypothetical protein
LNERTKKQAKPNDEDNKIYTGNRDCGGNLDISDGGKKRRREITTRSKIAAQRQIAA